MRYSSKYLTINLGSAYIDYVAAIFIDGFKVNPNKANRAIHKSFYLSFGFFCIRFYIEIKWGYKKTSEK